MTRSRYARRVFTGLIQSLGTVAAIAVTASGKRILIRPDSGGSIPELGASISVNGCCLTLAAVDGGAFAFDVIPQTLALTTLGAFIVGARVHLEMSATPSTLLGGHLVLGHVDGVATVHAISTAQGECRITLHAPIGVADAIISQGSITLDGVSLTIAKVHDARNFDVCLIPETLTRTTLAQWRVGTEVNLEADYLAKLVAKIVAQKISREK